MESQPDRLKIVVPHPAFDEGPDSPCYPASGPTNALPFEYAAFLAQKMGGELDGEIVQEARVGRTQLGRWERFLWQPSFVGDVETETSYLIVDDVATLGATFAALRTHILQHGGTVCAVSALAHETGRHQTFPITSRTIASIVDLYGPDVFGFWNEAVGHDIQDLTEPEVAFLACWGSSTGISRGGPLLLRLRGRLNEAASSGKQRARATVRKAGVSLHPRLAAANRG